MRKGFTILELMIAITIIAILSTIGAYAYSNLIRRSRTKQAITFFAAASGAQSTYFNLYGQYCASWLGSVSDAAYDPPGSAIRGRAHNWNNPHENWGICGISLPSATHFQYVMIAGGPNDQCSNPSNMPASGGRSVAVTACDAICEGSPPCAPGKHWYYILARADQDGDGFFSLFGSSSTMADSHWYAPGVELE